MGCKSFLAAVFLVCLYQVQGSSVVTPVFLQTGEDLLLTVMKPDDLEEEAIVFWNFNKNGLVRFVPDAKPKVSPGYDGRLELPAKNYSVKLKNVTKADSGVYTVHQLVTTVQTIEEYNVTVQDPVSPVELTVDFVSRSSDSCNLTVTCSTQDAHINSFFQCDNQTCSQEGGERSEVTTSGASLHVYLEDDFIICNHSNQVNWTNNTLFAKHSCTQHTGEEQASNIKVEEVVLPILAVIILSAAAAAVLYIRNRRISRMETIDNTVYEIPQRETTTQSMDQMIYDDSYSSPTSTYALVGPHTGGTTLPESTYAQVQKPTRS